MSKRGVGCVAVSQTPVLSDAQGITSSPRRHQAVFGWTELVPWGVALQRWCSWQRCVHDVASLGSVPGSTRLEPGLARSEGASKFYDLYTHVLGGSNDSSVNALRFPELGARSPVRLRLGPLCRGLLERSQHEETTRKLLAAQAEVSRMPFLDQQISELKDALEQAPRNEAEASEVAHMEGSVREANGLTGALKDELVRLEVAAAQDEVSPLHLNAPRSPALHLKPRLKPVSSSSPSPHHTKHLWL
ncbi:hypothetical protein Efla_004061 [Eimeria flavescens]